MKYLATILFALLAITGPSFATVVDVCYNDVEAACSSRPTTSEAPILAKCNAKYGAIEGLQSDLQAYANAHIETNFDFLLMSAHFGNYEANREGFKALYRKLSDEAWKQGIEIIKFVNKRGGRMEFNQMPHFQRNVKDNRVMALNEVKSLARALDVEKQLADRALAMHHTATATGGKADASIAHFLEEQFMEGQADTIRKLAGHTSDLKNLLDSRDASLALFMFDEYLGKTL
jgi:ferritin heavy chain